MEKRFILAIDQGTTGTRVILFDHGGEVHSSAYREIRQLYPYPGWVEHDPIEYWETIQWCTDAALREGKISVDEIAAIGITDQRETTILWDRKTGLPLHNAIVWQCRRTSAMCDWLKAEGYEPVVRQKTGLTIDAYFSATKVRWLLDNVPGIREGVAKGEVCMGTVDSWIMWNLSGGAFHVTDYSNAARTLLLNVHTLEWDEELLNIMGVPRSILPRMLPSSGVLAETSPDRFYGRRIPIAGCAGDQSASTFGQTCFDPGTVKNSYGTALALMMNLGGDFVASKNGLTTDLLWHLRGKTCFSLEGVVFIGGAVVQWLRDGLRIIDNAEECSALAAAAEDTGGVYLVPAFTGLCAPYWDQYARGMIIGITRGTGREQICRAALESIAYQTRDCLEAMRRDSGIDALTLRVDGGATRSDFLMQLQADLLGIPVERPKVSEMASRGAAYLAGLGIGFWRDEDELRSHWKLDRVFEPSIGEDEREGKYKSWQDAVSRSLKWEHVPHPVGGG